MKKRLIIAALAAVFSMGGLAACGDDDTEDTPAPAPAASAEPDAPELSGEPIVIGSICSCSGPQANSLAQTKAVLEGWAKWKNANGGINGHPVKISVIDDGADAAKATQAAKRLIEQEKVIAIVGQQSLVDAAWAKVAQDAGVPVIGASSYNQAFMTEPGFFTTGAQTPAVIYGMLEQAKAAGKTKIAMMPCAEAPACGEVTPLIKAFAGIVGGIEVVYEAKITVTQPSYTANCLAARDKDADAAMIIQNAATVMRVADECARQGYKPLQLNISATVGPSWADNANMDGTIATMPQPPLADQSIAATKEFHENLDRYAPGVSESAEYNEANLWSWSAGEAFALAAERGEVTPDSTGDDVVKGLRTFENETVGGLTPPLTFTAEGPSPLIPCYFTTVVTGGEFTAPDGAEPTCLEPAKVQKIGAVLQAAAG
jgi:branched-chain amino acid transport system substrate-binding protein